MSHPSNLVPYRPYFAAQNLDELTLLTGLLRPPKLRLSESSVMPTIKEFAGKRYQFNEDGSVIDLSNATVSEPPASQKAKNVVEQVQQSAQEIVQAVEEVVKPKARRGRPRKKDDASN